MRLTPDQQQILANALRARRADIVSERTRDAQDYSSKWNDGREAKARQLDQERDDIDALLSALSKPAGTFDW